jgi:hypothetical protein
MTPQRNRQIVYHKRVAADPGTPPDELLQVALEFPHTVSTNPTLAMMVAAMDPALQRASPLALCLVATCPEGGALETLIETATLDHPSKTAMREFLQIRRRFGAQVVSNGDDPSPTDSSLVEKYSPLSADCLAEVRATHYLAARTGASRISGEIGAYASENPMLHFPDGSTLESPDLFAFPELGKWDALIDSDLISGQISIEIRPNLQSVDRAEGQCHRGRPSRLSVSTFTPRGSGDGFDIPPPDEFHAEIIAKCIEQIALILERPRHHTLLLRVPGSQEDACTDAPEAWTLTGSDASQILEDLGWEDSDGSAGHGSSIESLMGQIGPLYDETSLEDLEAIELTEEQRARAQTLVQEIARCWVPVASADRPGRLDAIDQSFIAVAPRGRAYVRFHDWWMADRRLLLHIPLRPEVSGAIA